MTPDEDVVYVMRICNAIGVTVHVRGTDERVVVEYKDRKTKRIVGGIELKRRIKAHLE